MTVSKTSGAKFYIGPVANPNTINAMTDEDAVTFFEGISGGDWDEVEEIESFGEFGDKADKATFAAVGDRRMRKFKTVRDAGMLQIVCGRDPHDAGQLALVAAEKTDSNHAFKVVYADHTENAGSTDSVDYFAALVMTRPTNLGGNSDITKITFEIDINTAIYDVPGDAGS